MNTVVTIFALGRTTNPFHSNLIWFWIDENNIKLIYNIFPTVLDAWANCKQHSRLNLVLNYDGITCLLFATLSFTPILKHHLFLPSNCRSSHNMIRVIWITFLLEFSQGSTLKFIYTVRLVKYFFSVSKLSYKMFHWSLLVLC